MSQNITNSHKFSAAFSILLLATLASAATKVSFNSQGNIQIDNKPFFPIACWVYSIDPTVLADLREHHFNTVVGVGFKPDDTKALEDHGIMMIPPPTDAFLAHKDSPSMLAWYLQDEPEEHGVTPEQVKQKYDDLKSKDPNHPIGITHDTLAGPPKYIGSCDFTMTDVYPVTRDRDWPLNAVGIYTDGPRKVHGPNWPNFTFIQTFGGPDSDGGKWAQPLPHEIRFMAYDALVHRANGIFYFSYWPRAATTWAQVAKVNNELRRLTPWLLADGVEASCRSSAPGVEIRAKRIDDRWLILIVNANKKETTAKISVEGLTDQKLRPAFEAGPDQNVTAGKWTERIEGFGVKIYLVGDDPETK